MPRFSYSASTSPGLAHPSKAFVWGILVLGLCATGVFSLGLWNALQITFAGRSATGKVLEFHKTGSHSASVVGQVEVTMPGHAPFRAEVDDALGSQEWSVGGDVSLRCAEIHSGYLTCSADIGPWRLPFPIILVGIALAMVVWSANRIRRR